MKMERELEEKPKWLGLQWVRGLAALLVVVSHIPYWQNHGTFTNELSRHFVPRLGALSVAVFFCLSGIVILLTHGREIGAPAPLRWRLLLGFWIKRVFRIHPAYWCFASINYLLFRLGYIMPDIYVGTLHFTWDFVKAARGEKSDLFVFRSGQPGMVPDRSNAAVSGHPDGTEPDGSRRSPMVSKTRPGIGGYQLHPLSGTFSGSDATLSTDRASG